MSYTVGESVSGTVSGVTDYGAFVKLGDGSTGMIHISKLSRDFVSDIHSVIKKGDSVTATVISLDNNKIALSLIGDSFNKRDQGFSPRRQSVQKTDFESMLSSFKSASDERLSHIPREKRKRR
ncbi:MAG: S1 RNA-binding domain-containing protein [Ruminococcaceae bacterium]|nr:S1 RNA-binding domain-containing protein [Oscillospiraceae bacterium]